MVERVNPFSLYKGLIATFSLLKLKKQITMKSWWVTNSIKDYYIEDHLKSLFIYHTKCDMVNTSKVII